VSSVRSRGPIESTRTFSARISSPARGSPSATRGPSLAGWHSSVKTAAELRYGAIRRGWGKPRMLRTEATIERVEVVHSGPELVASTHSFALTDRWIAATAIRLGIPPVSNDRIVAGAPGLQLETLASG
jgi:predicted nucleic acid-binding protein